MKTMVRISAVFCSLFFTFALLGQPSPDPEIFSDNKKFSAEISTVQLDKPLLTVFAHDGDSKRQLWSRSLAPKEEEEDAPSSGMPFNSHAIRTIVSDDGKTVVLRARHYQPDQPTLRILTQAGGDKNYQQDELRDLLVGEWEDWEQPQSLEFILQNEKPPLYAMWFPREAEWLALDLEKLTLRKADAPLSTRLDSLALPRAREIAREVRPTGIKKLLQPVMQRAAEFVPGLMGQNQPQSPFYERGEAAYRFLAHKKNAEDKKLIEELLEVPLQRSISVIGGGPGPTVILTLGARERALADELLSNWDGNEQDPLDNQEESFDLMFYGSGPGGRKLSGISGEVFLPFGAPKNAGAVWLYLIPGRVPKGKWAEDDAVLKAWHNPNDRMFGGQGEADPIDQLSFRFSTLEPGEYRVKAVWDRRPPNTRPDDKSICLPEAGDYESAESETLKLAPGQNVTRLQLNCTNRVGEAEEYFAADDLWQKQNPASKETRRQRSAGPQKVITRAPIKAWILKTNENTASVELKRVQLAETRQTHNTSAKRLGVAFAMPGVKRNDSPMIKGKLVDEHGCVFETSGHNRRGNSFEMNFTIVPFAAKQIVLSLSREDHQDADGRPFQNGPRETTLASFTLTNLCRITPADWKPDPERPKRDLDIVSVELTAFEPAATEYARPAHFGPGGQPFQPPQNKFTFTANGKPAPGWRKVRAQFQDRWGNVSQHIAAFCEKEEVIQYSVSLLRDPVKGAFSADEKVEIPLQRIPGAGETIPIGVRKEVQGQDFEVISVGGTGEFIYKNGEFISALPEIDEDDSAPLLLGPEYGPHFGPQFPAHFQGRPVQPKMYLKPGPQTQPGFDWMRRELGKGQITLASRIPHVVCRVQEPEDDTMFALVEQDTSVPDPLNPPSRHYYGGPRQYNVVQFLPLDFRAGDADRKLSFVVQKMRKAEFFIRVPKGSIPSNQRGR